MHRRERDHRRRRAETRPAAPQAQGAAGWSRKLQAISDTTDTYRHRRFSSRRVGASTGVIEEPNAILVRSRVPRTGAAFARGAEIPRVHSPADYDGGARPHAVARRARAALPGSPRPPGRSHESSPRRSSLRSARQGAGAWERAALAAPRARRLAAAGCAAGLESAGASRRHFAGLARSMGGTACHGRNPGAGQEHPSVTGLPAAPGCARRSGR